MCQGRECREISNPEADLQLIAPPANRKLFKSRFVKTRKMNGHQAQLRSKRVGCGEWCCSEWLCPCCHWASSQLSQTAGWAEVFRGEVPKTLRPYDLAPFLENKVE